MPYVLLLAAFLWVYMCVRFLRKNERGLILRLGRLMGDIMSPLGPGFVWTFWPIDTLLRWKVVAGDENLLGTEGVWEFDTKEGQFGLVRIKGQRWGATAGREIPQGQNVCVAGIDGINLLVEVGPIAKSPETLLDEEIARKLEFLQQLGREKKGLLRNEAATEHFELAKLYERKGDAEAASRHYHAAEELKRDIRESYGSNQG